MSHWEGMRNAHSEWDYLFPPPYLLLIHNNTNEPEHLATENTKLVRYKLESAKYFCSLFRNKEVVKCSSPPANVKMLRNHSDYYKKRRGWRAIRLNHRMEYGLMRGTQGLLLMNTSQCTQIDRWPLWSIYDDGDSTLLLIRRDNLDNKDKSSVSFISLSWRVDHASSSSSSYSSIFFIGSISSYSW